MADDGVLFLGGAETVLGISDAFKPTPQLRGLYAPTPAGESAQSILRPVQGAGSGGT